MGAVCWSRATTPAALIGSGVGMVLTLIWELQGIKMLPVILPHPLAPSVLPGLATAFFINVFLFVVISYMTRPQSPEQVEKYHGLLGQGALISCFRAFEGLVKPNPNGVATAT